MRRRQILKLALAAAATGALTIGTAVAQDTIKIGTVAPKTGPLSAGAATTHWPNVALWVKQVNDRGGLKLKSGQKKIELIEYDYQTNPGAHIKAAQRLATQDKVDFIIAPYGTGFNLAAAPSTLNSTTRTSRSAPFPIRSTNSPSGIPTSSLRWVPPPTSPVRWRRS